MSQDTKESRTRPINTQHPANCIPRIRMRPGMLAENPFKQTATSLFPLFFLADEPCCWGIICISAITTDKSIRHTRLSYPPNEPIKTGDSLPVAQRLSTFLILPFAPSSLTATWSLETGIIARLSHQSTPVREALEIIFCLPMAAL